MIARLQHAFRAQLVPLVAGFLVIGGIVGVRAYLAEVQQRDNEALRHALQFERQLGEVLSLAQEAETGQRGFLLTNEEAYLAPYEAAASALPAHIDVIERASSASEAERLILISQLRAAVNDRLSEMAETVTLWRSGYREDAMSIVRSDRGKLAMERIRNALADLTRDQAAQVQARLARTEALEWWLRIGSFAALLALLLVGLFTTRDASRRIREVAAAHSELAAANEALRREAENREKAELQMRQLQKMEAVGQLTGGIAHDFNNMLAVIISATNLIQRKLSRGDTDIGKFVEAASDAATRAGELTARLLAFSRQQPLAPQLVDPNRLVVGMSDLLRRTLGESIRIETVLAGGLWKTRADPSQLENALVNLCVNARDAMESDGKLTIETANCHLDEAYAAAHPDVPAGQYVLLAVTDTGSGMTQEVVAKAFEPFFTTKPVNKGTGLGLSQVFGFVKQSGGHVKIYSELGQGTTVKIYLPRHVGQEETRQPEKRAEVAAPSTNGTILLVEDDDRVRAATSDALHELGFRVIVAASGAEALQKLEQNPDIVLLFTDIVMAGMSGRQLADQAVPLYPSLKVLYTTGFTKNAVVHNGVLDHGVNFLSKPFTLAQLSAKLREVLGQ